MMNDETQDSLTPSARRINKLAAEVHARTYLEVGVQKGKTFFDVAIPQRIAVDPRFLFDAQEFVKEGLSFQETTSDDYFSHLPSAEKFDIIFLDGLHTFEQTYRDLCNSLLHVHDRTLIMIDDTKPTDVFSALPCESKWWHSVGRPAAKGRPGTVTYSRSFSPSTTFILG